MRTRGLETTVQWYVPLLFTKYLVRFQTEERDSK
jgi:hypothetical protein